MVAAYKAAVGVWGMRPRDFWELDPQEFWWQRDARAQQVAGKNTYAGGLTESEVREIHAELVERGELTHG